MLHEEDVDVIEGLFSHWQLLKRRILQTQLIQIQYP
jgi:hypothetical protein